MTYPLIGNYGINAEDRESQRPAGRGLRRPRTDRACRATSARSDRSTTTWRDSNVIGIEGIDTRALVRRLRVRGAMNGVLSTTDLDDASLVAKARASPGMVGRDLVREVMPRSRSTGTRASTARSLDARLPPRPADASRRRPRLRHEVEHPRAAWSQVGCRVTVVPGTATADDVLDHKPDGIFLSNGPGDPGAARLRHRHRSASCVGKKPIFGICLGHQLLGLAFGGEDVQAQVRPPRRQPAGAQRADRPGRDHHAEPRLRRRSRHAAAPTSSRRTSTSTTRPSKACGTRSCRSSACSITPKPSAGPHDSSYLFEEFRKLMG